MSILLFEPYSKFTFHSNLNQIWSFIKTTTQFSHLISTINNRILTEPIQISKERTYELNSKFRFLYKEMIKIYFTVEALVETDYYCMIQWKMSELNSDKFNLSDVNINIHLHYYTPDSTVLICSIQGNLLSNIIQLQRKLAVPQHQPQRILHQIYQSIERFLINKPIVHLNCESRIIATPFKASKNYFGSIKICTGLIGRIISLTSDEICKGTIVVTMIKSFENQKEEELIFQVQKCHVTHNSFKTRFFIYEKNKSTPIRAMTTELYKVNDNETLAVLTHHFYYAIDKGHFNLYSMIKKKFLRKLSYVIDAISNEQPMLHAK